MLSVVREPTTGNLPPDHPRMSLVRRRQGATPDQPTFLAGVTGAIGWAPGSRRVWTALGGEREVNVVVGFCGFARRLKR